MSAQNSLSCCSWGPDAFINLAKLPTNISHLSLEKPHLTISTGVWMSVFLELEEEWEVAEFTKATLSETIHAMKSGFSLSRALEDPL